MGLPMGREEFQKIEAYVRRIMTGDAAHDLEHVYRVLGNALRIARTEPECDLRLLTAACMLHDVGRPAQNQNPALCHARVGAQMAREYLLQSGWREEDVQRVAQAIERHRFRGENPPQSLEDKILFDADKLDVCGALGVARTLMYQGHHRLPLYTMREGHICQTDGASFLSEYNRKLKRLYDGFQTREGARLAGARRKAAEQYVQALIEEIEFGRAGFAEQDWQK
jgi:uncharacterized protein